MNEIATMRIPMPPSESAAIIQMIERAARDPSIDIDKMERLLQMQERVLARESKTAYAAALAGMQPQLPSIVERGKIDFGRGGKQQSYALWEDINDAIRPVLSEHGFALSFRTGRDGDKIVVIGILSHRAGHSEETTMHLPIDASGAKNPVQAVGSSISYGKRYTAGALLNLTSRASDEADDDGRSAGGTEKINDAQVQELIDLINRTGTNQDIFLVYFHCASLDEMPKTSFDEAKRMLTQKAKMAAKAQEQKP